MSKENKDKSWIRPRHKVIAAIAKAFLWPYLKIKYKVKIDRMDELKDRPYLILYNHQTPLDQFMLGLASPVPLYYVATEDIFSTGFLAKILIWGANPIPIKKSGNDLRAVKTAMRVAKEGGSIAIAPEGNRTYSGETCYIKPSIVKLVKALKLPVAFYVFEGGYGKEPRWADCSRSGSMKLTLRDKISYDDIAELSDEQLYRLILKELYNDDSEYPERYYSKKSAEYLERLIYVCPECGLSTFKSKDDTLSCEKCDLSVKYTEDKNFLRQGEIFIFNNVLDWYKYQVDRVNRLDMVGFGDAKIYEDLTQLSEVIPYQKKRLISSNAILSVYGNGIGIKTEGVEEKKVPFEEIDNMAICGRNKLNIYLKDITYQFKGDKRFNAIKYMNLYHRYRNQTGLNQDENMLEFLGM